MGPWQKLAICLQVVHAKRFEQDPQELSVALKADGVCLQ